MSRAERRERTELKRLKYMDIITKAMIEEKENGVTEMCAAGDRMAAKLISKCPQEKSLIVDVVMRICDKLKPGEYMCNCTSEDCAWAGIIDPDKVCPECGNLIEPSDDIHP